MSLLAHWKYIWNSPIFLVGHLCGPQFPLHSRKIQKKHAYTCFACYPTYCNDQYLHSQLSPVTQLPGPLLFVKRHDLPLCRPGGKSNWHWAYCMSVGLLNCSESKGSFFCIVLEGFLLPCPTAAAGRTLMSQGTDWALLNASEETSAVLNCTDEFVWNSDVLKVYRTSWHIVHLKENSCLLKRIWTVAGTTHRAATCFCPPQTNYTPALQFLTASYNSLLPSHLQSWSFD